MYDKTTTRSKLQKLNAFINSNIRLKFNVYTYEILLPKMDFFFFFHKRRDNKINSNKKRASKASLKEHQGKMKCMSGYQK